MRNNVNTKSPGETAKSPPLLRMSKRDGIGTGKKWAIRGLALALSLLVGSIFVVILGESPLLVYGDIVSGSLKSSTARATTARLAIPLLGTALALAPAFKMKFWNIGAEGQLMMGAVAATYFALFCPVTLPRPLLLLVMFLAACAAGGIWGLIPAYCKAKWNTNETLFTLMLNYIALGIEKYLQQGPWIDPGGRGFPIIATFSQSARLPKLFGVHIGWIIVLLFTILLHIYLQRSKQGYEIAVVGESQRTARYAGMNVSKILLRTMFLSGAMAGAVGMLVVSGADYTLNTGTSGGVGFTAITVAWLAGLNPFAMVGIALFLAVLTKGANTIQTDFGIPASASKVLTGMILFFMLSSEFFIQYELHGRPRGRGQQGDSAGGAGEG